MALWIVHRLAMRIDYEYTRTDLIVVSLICFFIGSMLGCLILDATL